MSVVRLKHPISHYKRIRWVTTGGVVHFFSTRKEAEKFAKQYKAKVRDEKVDWKSI